RIRQKSKELGDPAIIAATALRPPTSPRFSPFRRGSSRERPFDKLSNEIWQTTDVVEVIFCGWPLTWAGLFRGTHVRRSALTKEEAPTTQRSAVARSQDRMRTQLGAKADASNESAEGRGRATK
ncbi:MAG: hypothetical protein WCG75_11020, partial [Armatimonadota bacterium]